MHAEARWFGFLEWMLNSRAPVTRAVIHLKMNSIPSEKDWNMAENGIDLDTSHAYRMFNGKTHEQAVAMFVEASEFYQEDVMWMPLPCFKFYVRAYVQYLNSDAAVGDSDGSNCFFSLVQFRLNEILKLDEPLQTMKFPNFDGRGFGIVTDS